MKITVVGGGIIGCATAYELAKAGCAVTLFERATPGAEASGAAGGLLVPLGAPTGSAFEGLALASWRLYPELVDELRERTGIDVEYVTRGTIYPLLDAEDVRQAEARVASAGSRERTSAVSHASIPNSRISRPATRVSARRTSSASNSG